MGNLGYKRSLATSAGAYKKPSWEGGQAWELFNTQHAHGSSQWFVSATLNNLYYPYDET